jgi:hypothetical protein
MFSRVNPQHERTSLHVAVINGDAATVEVLVAGPMLIDITDSVVYL